MFCPWNGWLIRSDRDNGKENTCLALPCLALGKQKPETIPRVQSSTSMSTCMKESGECPRVFTQAEENKTIQADINMGRGCLTGGEIRPGNDGPR